MHTYFCESCGAQVDIEEIEAVLSPPEYYENGKCIPCFEKEEEN
jgi:hypothetical protein